MGEARSERQGAGSRGQEMASGPPLLEGQAREGIVWAEREAAVVDAARREVEVTIIKPGLSNNGLHYSEDVLRDSLPLWEGAAAFCDHPTAIDQTRAGGRSVRDLVGVYAEPRYQEGVRARLRFLPGAEWLYQVVAASIADREAGRATADMGISADMVVMKERQNGYWEVRQIKKVSSADVVFQPSAGGRFERIVEAWRRVRLGERGTSPGQGQMPRPTQELMEKQEDYAMAEDGETRSREQEASDLQRMRAELEVEKERVLEARRALCGETLEAKLAASGLPLAAQRELRGRFAGRVYEAWELDSAIGSLKAILGEIFQGGVVKDMGAGRATVKVGLNPLEKMQMAVDRLFGLEVADSSVPRLSGIREAYLLITGDHQFRGQYNWEESVVREANEVTTSVMAQIVHVSMTKRLVRDYRAQPKWWAPFVVKVPVRDMKEQRRILLYDFASLSTVSENGTYSNLAWDDAAETYTPSKRGNIVYVTLETIMNDDLAAITRIPSKLAISAATTINEFVSSLFTSNSGEGPAMADGYNVFDATNHQSNKGSSALDSDALKAALSTMFKYTNSASKRIGVHGKYLLVPPDLMWTALEITKSEGRPGTANNDVNVLHNIVEAIVVPNWTDANNWYVMAEPTQIESIELGFLNGREEPELLVQDNPTDGSVFTNDAISYKVRHIYGGGWLDYRAAYGSVVA